MVDITDFDLKAFDAQDDELKNVRASTATSWRAYFEGKGEPESMVASIKQQGDELAIAVSKEVGKSVVITRVYCDDAFVVVEFVSLRCTCRDAETPLLKELKAADSAFAEVQRELAAKTGIDALTALARRRQIWGRYWQHPCKPETPLAALIHAKAVLRRWHLMQSPRVDPDVHIDMRDLWVLIKEMREARAKERTRAKDVKPR